MVGLSKTGLEETATQRDSSAFAAVKALVMVMGRRESKRLRNSECGVLRFVGLRLLCLFFEK